MTRCYAQLTDNLLVIGNDLIERRFAFHFGHLRTLALIDKASDHTWHYPADAPDLLLSGESTDAIEPVFDSRQVADHPIAPPHLRVTITCKLGRIALRRVFRLYDHVPAIACDLYLRGASDQVWRSAAAVSTDNIEQFAKLDRGEFRAPVLDHVHLPHPHIALTAAQFFDRTDHCNTLVRTHHLVPYNAPASLTGNILLACDPITGRGLVMLKESPCSDIQLANPGCDFRITRNGVQCVGIGLDPADLHPTDWTRAYGCVIALGSADRFNLLDALRRYQQQLRRHENDRDFQLMANTWGDRNRDARMSESFILRELDACANLGVTHLQLDDGWQKGTSPNSANAGGTHDSLGHAADFWTPRPGRFPNGLQPVIARAKELNIQMGLWYAPLHADHYANWQRDADTLIGLYQQFGVRVFKIDMVEITTKRAESNLRRLFDHVVRGTHGNVCFNLDATAGHRYGYHSFREFGHTFVENRYTDWVNYYPHRTLRNLWMLSRYLPTQCLQFEFLNKWRNATKYGNDPLAPANVPFAYCFALTMMAQPLAWFEASGLPPEAFDIAPLIGTYREHQPAIHAGRIHPIGDEPSGTSWTGFQSIATSGGGYVLILREKNDRPSHAIKLHALRNQHLRFDAIAGDARDFTADGNDVNFTLPGEFTFGLWRYIAS